MPWIRRSTAGPRPSSTPAPGRSTCRWKPGAARPTPPESLRSISPARCWPTAWRARGVTALMSAALQGDALRLPLASGSVDAIVSAFLPRNLDSLPRAWSGFARVLRPGGVLVILEMTPIRTPVFRHLFRLYFHRWIPWVGRRISGHRSGLHLATGVGGRLSHGAGAGPTRSKPPALLTCGSANTPWAPWPSTEARRLMTAVVSPIESQVRRGRPSWPDMRDGGFLQSWRWGELKSRYGWRAIRLGLPRGDGGLAAGVQVLIRTRRVGPGGPRVGLAYVPRGPLADNPRTTRRRRCAHAAIEVGRASRRILRAHRAAERCRRRCAFAPVGFRPSSQFVQIPRTAVVDLERPEIRHPRRLQVQDAVQHPARRPARRGGGACRRTTPTSRHSSDLMGR